MTPEEMHLFGTKVAELVDAKIAAHVADMKLMVAKAVDAGHASVTRADQVETKLKDHEERIRKLESAINTRAAE